MCRQDGEKTPGLLAYILLSYITCGFYSYYWAYKLGNRLKENAPGYGLYFSEGGTEVLIWDLIGYISCFIGSYIATNILIRNTNRLAREYNKKFGL